MVNQVQKLYEDKSQIAKILNESTYILQFEIDTNRGFLSQTSDNIQIQQRDAKLLGEKLLGSISQIDKLELMLQFTHVGSLFAETGHHYIDTLQHTIRDIEDAKHGEINSDLLTHDQLGETIKAHIRKDSTEILPIDAENPDLGLLSKISNLHLLHSEGKFITKIEIPLARKPMMKLYRMIPCKAQSMPKNTTGAVFIQPETKYIVVSLDNQHYYKATVEYFQKFVQIQEIMKTCDIRILRQYKNQWTWLEESQNWLISTAEPINVNIVCEDLTSFTITLNNTGTLSLKGKCEGRTASDWIRSSMMFHVVPLDLNS